MGADKQLPLGPGVRVVRREGPLLALDKPEGVRSHPNEPGVVDVLALLAAPYDLDGEFYRLDGMEIHLLNRLDAPTSGLILISLDAAVARR
jgi:23S rRNA-/tRNA-specific pseudouridylate synthase